MASLRAVFHRVEKTITVHTDTVIGNANANVPTIIHVYPDIHKSGFGRDGVVNNVRYGRHELIASVPQAFDHACRIREQYMGVTHRHPPIS